MQKQYVKGERRRSGEFCSVDGTEVGDIKYVEEEEEEEVKKMESAEMCEELEEERGLRFSNLRLTLLWFLELVEGEKEYESAGRKEIQKERRRSMRREVAGRGGW